MFVYSNFKKLKNDLSIFLREVTQDIYLNRKFVCLGCRGLNIKGQNNFSNVSNIQSNSILKEKSKVTPITPQASGFTS